MDKVSIVPLPHRAALRVFAEPLCRHLGWFGFFLLLAPIVGPRGYGIFALALSGIALAEAMLSESAIQVLVDLKSADERHLSTALIATVTAGAAMSLVLYAAAGRIGVMLDEAPLADLFQSLTLLPLLGALGIVPTARLRRQARQLPFTAATIAGLAAGGGAALALAWAGAGPWSLVAQILVQRFIECAVLWIFAGGRVGLGWSHRHFAELAAGLDLRALVSVWPAISRHGACLVVGLTLGPVATGLYMLAARFAEALGDVCLAQPQSGITAFAGDIARRAGIVAFPAVITSAALIIIAPWVLDLRWWGAVPAAQILAISVMPAALSCLRTVTGRSPASEARWRAVQGISALALVALAAPWGLVAVASAMLTHASGFALAGLWAARQRLGPRWRIVSVEEVRPLAGACAAGLLLLVLTEPVGVALAPVPALCLLAGSSRLCYLLVCIQSTLRRTRPAPSLGRATPA